MQQATAQIVQVFIMGVIINTCIYRGLLSDTGYIYGIFVFSVNNFYSYCNKYAERVHSLSSSCKDHKATHTHVLSVSVITSYYYVHKYIPYRYNIEV